MPQFFIISIFFFQGFSLVLVQHKDRDFLVAFGGSKKEPSDQVNNVFESF